MKHIPYHEDRRTHHPSREPRQNEAFSQFYPFDVSEISSSEADEIEAYYANRYKWS